MLWQLCTWELLTVPGLCVRGRDRQPLHTALQSRPEPAEHRQSGPRASNLVPSRPRAPLPLQAEVCPALLSPLAFPPQDWTSRPSLVFAVLLLDGTLVCGPASPHRAASSPRAKEMTSVPHCPALSPLFYVSQGPASFLGPSLELRTGPTVLHLQEVVKPLVHE